jgi:polyhydroxybutyrate depolymerase
MVAGTGAPGQTVPPSPLRRHPRRCSAAAAAAVVIAAVALLLGGVPASPGDAAETPTAQGGDCAPPASGDTTVRLTVAGEVRSALVHVPPGAALRTPAPLVIALHGQGGDGPWMAGYTGLSELADREGFIALYPSARPQRRSWALRAGDAHDDMPFMSLLIDRALAGLCADPARVYVTGVSNGGGFAGRIGCELSDRVAAIAPVAGGYRALAPCRPARPVSVLEIHGTSDPVVPYAGRPPDRAGSVTRFLLGWRRIDGCPGRAQRRALAAGVAWLGWSGCAEGTRVEHIRLAGVGHTWPGARAADGTRAPGPLWASAAAWRFLRGQVRVPRR